MVPDSGAGETTPANWCLAPSASLLLGHEVPINQNLNDAQNGFYLLMDLSGRVRMEECDDSREQQLVEVGQWGRLAQRDHADHHCHADLHHLYTTCQWGRLAQHHHADLCCRGDHRRHADLHHHGNLHGHADCHTCVGFGAKVWKVWGEIAGGCQTGLDLLTKKLFTEGRPGAEIGECDLDKPNDVKQCFYKKEINNASQGADTGWDRGLQSARPDQGRRVQWKSLLVNSQKYS